MNHSVDAAELTEYLQREIPPAGAMQIRFLEVSTERVRCEAPYEANKNDHQSAFGGSLASIAMLCGWAQVHVLLRAHGLDASTAIRTADLKFVAPARGLLEAETEPLDEKAVAKFVKTTQRFGKGRLEVTTTIRSEGEIVMQQVGDFAVGTEAAVERP